MDHEAQSSSDASKANAPPASLEWIERLIRIDTTSRESNLGLIETVRDHLQKAGVSVVLTHDAERRKANLFATLAATDGRQTGGIVLSGHTDVVPVDGQTWRSDPFRPEIRDGKLYGRGSADMKGFIGCVLTALPAMQAARLAKPIHFAFSFDEEVGCAGAPLMIEELIARGVAPEGCIVGEPTSMRPVVAHKGINVYRCCVRGHAAHSSRTPYGLNAIEHAARLICYIRDLADELRQRGPFDEAFDVPFSTAQTSTIKGGNAVNTVPSDCEFVFEFRNLPTLEPHSIIERIESHGRNVILPRMLAEHPSAAIEFEKIASAPGLDVAEQAAVTTLVQALTADHKIRKVAYGTEAGLFDRAGIPSVVCGPGDIADAHRPDEFVELAQIAQCEKFLTDLTRSMSV
jgi:acetylornithine deacetylase